MRETTMIRWYGEDGGKGYTCEHGTDIPAGYEVRWHGEFENCTAYSLGTAATPSEAKAIVEQEVRMR